MNADPLTTYLRLYKRGKAVWYSFIPNFVYPTASDAADVIHEMNC